MSALGRLGSQTDSLYILGGVNVHQYTRSEKSRQTLVSDEILVTQGNKVCEVARIVAADIIMYASAGHKIEGLVNRMCYVTYSLTEKYFEVKSGEEQSLLKSRIAGYFYFHY